MGATEAKMGFLEVCVEMMNYAGAGEPTRQSMLAGLLFLIAAFFLALNLKKPRKEG